MIQLIDVTKAFKNNVVLDGISMDFRDGELTVLIGPSGCGKTTTLKMINRLIPATGGRILIDGGYRIHRQGEVAPKYGIRNPAGRTVSPYDHTAEYRNHREVGREG